MLRRLAGLVLLISAAVCGALWWSRRSLPYNEQGRYFDSTTSTVYLEQSVVVIGGVTLCCLFGAVILYGVGRK